MKKYLVVLFAILALGVYGTACDGGGDGGGGGLDTTVPAEDTVVPPEDTVVPSEDTVVPPEDTVVPPEDMVVPPEDTVEPPVGACLNADDGAILGADGGAAAKAAATDCALACIAEPDVPGIIACANPCVIEDTGLTEDCAGCYTAIIACTFVNCLGLCAADPSSEACVTCQTEAGCYTDFYACTGLEPPVEVPVDQCLGDEDMAIIGPDGGAAASAAATDCALGCIAEPDLPGIIACANPCVIEDTGLTEGCAGCYTGIIGCTFVYCLADCAADPDSEACGTCQTENGCYVTFYECTGLTPPE